MRVHGLRKVGLSRAAAKQRSRELLITATLDSIAKRGFAETTLARVAKGAGMSRGIVNFHFASKDELFIEALRFTRAAVLLYDDATGTIAGAVSQAGQRPGRDRVRFIRGPLTEFPAALDAAEKGRAVHVAAGDPGVPERFREGFGVSACVVVPLQVRGHLLGFIAADRGGVDFEALRAELELATTLAQPAAIALEQARLHGSLQERADLLVAVNELARAVDGRHFVVGRDHHRRRTDDACRRRSEVEVLDRGQDAVEVGEPPVRQQVDGGPPVLKSGGVPLAEGRRVDRLEKDLVESGPVPAASTVPGDPPQLPGALDHRRIAPDRHGGGKKRARPIGMIRRHQRRHEAAERRPRQVDRLDAEGVE